MNTSATDLRKTLSAAAQQPYTIPLIDLAGQTHRQVVVDREPGQYLGHPTTVLLEDQRTILAIYPKGHGHGELIMKRSTDGGLTWSDRLPLPANWATSQETPTMYRTVDPQGVRRLILFSARYPVRMAHSEDDGRTWTPLEPIGDYGGIVAMADMVRLKDNRYMALFHSLSRRTTPIEVNCACGTPATKVCGLCCWESDDCYYCDRCAPNHACGKGVMMPVDYTPRIQPEYEQGVFKTLSSDGGLTWSEPERILVDPELTHCEPGAVRSPDGNTIAMLLRENTRTANSHITFSEDEGETWTAPRELPTALTGDRHQAIYAPDGRLFISFRDMAHQTPTHGDWVGWVGTWDDLVRGREGQCRVRLVENHLDDRQRDWDCAYPCLERLPDGTLLATTYGHWRAGEKPYILSVRFRIDELDAAAG